MGESPQSVSNTQRSKKKKQVPDKKSSGESAESESAESESSDSDPNIVNEPTGSFMAYKEGMTYMMSTPAGDFPIGPKLGAKIGKLHFKMSLNKL